MNTNIFGRDMNDHENWSNLVNDIAKVVSKEPYKNEKRAFSISENEKVQSIQQAYLDILRKNENV